MWTRSRRFAAAALTAGSLIAPLSPASATPVMAGHPALSAASSDLVEHVYWRGRGWGHGGWGWGAPVAGGIIAGALIGGALAAPYGYGYGPYGYPPGYYAPGPAYYGAPPPPSGAEEYCMRRFRSYDPESGTYLGNDGRRHPCP
ncbi:BA14K family protein [Bradyrhizobium sp. U87765 SZCCT0131]|nr:MULTISPECIES: BA14K family protein [unclassified Bradyrhizobium]MBR1219282.1 BA14K family protein [Bradyrhizobium sp. U87765 SZCCT0131]MBR1261933.1 BA14K family protein [Bradyrhizobium sp. U87765 SZCCT0134]MBR1306214.1 BA14K family protein [Bradyrhizobium sp. U87765 SZCCT0110]MBR1317715.1 BA14K family protein [Bradyrhizobium sp. U87765 SZCCT0109]MBR1351417.1 BA14K family protein [Bradyrhizobium sp. U87765 SZCCT0048]